MGVASRSSSANRKRACPRLSQLIDESGRAAEKVSLVAEEETRASAGDRDHSQTLDPAL